MAAFASQETPIVPVVDALVSDLPSGRVPQQGREWRTLDLTTRAWTCISSNSSSLCGLLACSGNSGAEPACSIRHSATLLTKLVRRYSGAVTVHEAMEAYAVWPHLRGDPEDDDEDEDDGS